MACYRLTFDNRQVFEVDIDGKRVVPGSQATVCVGTIYRVIAGAREIQPLNRVSGGPLEMYAVSEDTVLLIAKQVLREITSSDIASIGVCGAPPAIPMFKPI